MRLTQDRTELDHCSKSHDSLVQTTHCVNYKIMYRKNKSFFSSTAPQFRRRVITPRWSTGEEKKTTGQFKQLHQQLSLFAVHKSLNITSLRVERVIAPALSLVRTRQHMPNTSDNGMVP